MEELICREGTVHSVIFQNAENGYTVLRLLTEAGHGEILAAAHMGVQALACIAALVVHGRADARDQLRALTVDDVRPQQAAARVRAPSDCNFSPSIRP